MKSEDGEVVERRRLAACCWGEGRSATCIVMLDEEGSLVDVLYLPSFSGLLHPMRPGVEYNIAHDPKKVRRAALGPRTGRLEAGHLCGFDERRTLSAAVGRCEPRRGVLPRKQAAGHLCRCPQPVLQGPQGGHEQDR